MKLYYRVVSGLLKRAGERVCRECQGFIDNGSKILDLGCGSGMIGQALKDFFGAEVLGADIKDNRINALPFRLIDGHTLPFRNDEFDVCFISYVLHHAQDPVALLKEARRVCRNKIIIYEDLPEGIWARLRCYAHRTLYPILGGSRTKTFNFRTQKQWKDLFRDLDLRVLAKKNPLTLFFGKKSWGIKKIIYILEKTGSPPHLTST